MMKRVVLYIFIVCITACKTAVKENHTLITVDYNSDDVASLSSWFSSVDVVPLELLNNQIIGNISKVEFYKDRIYLLDNQNNCIFVYGMSGDFIECFSKVGRGSGEYLNLMNIKVGKESIFLLDYSLRAILEYDLNWKFKRKIALDFFPEDFLLNDKGFFIYSGRTNQSEDYCFYQTDDSGRIMERYIQRSPIEKRAGHYLGSNPFCCQRDTFFSVRYGNPIYSMWDKKIVYKYDFKDKTCPDMILEPGEQDMSAPSFSYVVREHVFQQDSLLWISYSYQRKRRFATYDMEKQELLFSGELVNDLIPDFRFFPQWQQNNYWIDCVAAHHIVNDFPAVKEHFPQLKHLQELDNPVLFLYKMR